jgi:O-acetyl-ADP-ribose deacetylase (regulator of RNase III)
MAINSVTGNLLKQHDVDAIVNTVNCVGVMGKGIALQFKKQWPANFKAYATACKNEQVTLGSMFVYKLGAAILALLETYQSVNYGLSKIEVQKLAYFLQEAGENLKLKFIKHNFGPYADALRHALNTMGGHYIKGVGDGVVESQITPVEDALESAKQFLAESNTEINERIERVSELIECYQSPYGVELLSIVYWLAKHENYHNANEAFQAIQHWNARKKQLMPEKHVQATWDHLTATGWIN